MIKNIEILTVNYNTPDLLERLIESIRAIEGNYPIKVIDGSDKPEMRQKAKAVCDKYNNIILEQVGWNIHHGRGMNKGVIESQYDWVFIMDSDNYFKVPVIEKIYNTCIENDKVIAGWSCNVNQSGINVKVPNIKYYHPSMFLINTEYYHSLKLNNIGFIHHGSPCIEIMKYLHDRKISDKVGMSLEDIFQAYNVEEKGKITCLESRGTVNRFGYQF